MSCVHCGSEKLVKNGTKTLQTSQVVQQYWCKDCGRRFTQPLWTFSPEWLS